MKIPTGIFREYDIRGIVDSELTKEFAYWLGCSFVSYLKKNGIGNKFSVSVGRDARLSSDELAEGLIDGLQSGGASVFNLGTCPTPLLYFSTYHLNVDGAIMVTGSHNPPEYNGFKLCQGKETLFGPKIQALKKIMAEPDQIESRTLGTLKNEDLSQVYKQAILNSLLKKRVETELKVAVDAGNGVAGILATDLLERLGCQVVPLNCIPDGRFPKHHPDPTVLENLQELREVVLKEKCDLGIAFDGDGDRLGVLTEKGEVVFGDRLMFLFSQEILKTNPYATFISEVKCSKLMYEEIEKRGGRIIMWKTGHSLIKEKMRKEKASLAGEMSGHFFFADRYFGYDDAIYASLRLIGILDNARLEGKSLESLLAPFSKLVSSPEIRIDCSDERKEKVVTLIPTRLDELTEKSNLKIEKIITIDGVRIHFDKGWALVRASNTQPALVLRFEAWSSQMLARIREGILGLVEELIHKTST